MKEYLTLVLQPFGTLSTASAYLGVPPEMGEPDGLILIDATAVESPEKLILRLRSERPERRIVVLTASPTWQRARAVFEAGAMDYLPKALSLDVLREAFQQALLKPLV